MTTTGPGPRCRLPALLAIAFLTGGATEASAQSRGATVGQAAPPPPALQAPSSNNPVPPMPIPNVSPGPTIVSPGGPLLAPSAPTPLMLPSSPPAIAAPPPMPAMRPGEAALQAVARFGRDAPAITAGLHWRVYADKPDQAGVFRLVKEDRSAQPTFVLPSGTYVVHVALGLASAVKTVQARGEMREMFEIPAGGLTLKGQVGDVRIPTGQISFDIYKGSQFEPGERRPIATSVVTGDTVLLPEGTYYIVSKYGDGNAVVRSDIRVQIGKLTDVTVTHRAAAIMLKLVSKKGGEALANTDWAVVSPAGDTITESKGAFPRVILAEGEYRVIARNDNRVYQQDLKVITGVDGEIEVMAR
jgi:hypothetical protein